jgi:hypothetical protein
MKFEPKMGNRQLKAVITIRGGKTKSVDWTKLKLNLSEGKRASALDETTKGRKGP